MAETPSDPTGQPQPAGPRWAALFQASRDPVFLLNRHRRIVFVNRAWEELTGVPAVEARGRACPPAREPKPKDAVGRLLAVLCSPPLEVLEGRPTHARRLVVLPGGHCAWWDVDFLPFADGRGGEAILCRIRSAPGEAAAPAAPYHEGLRQLHDQLSERLGAKQAAQLWKPERLVALRERQVERHRLDLLTSDLPAVRRVVDQARLAAVSLVPVLLVGEPGAGKQWLARALHYRGVTRDQSLACLDCSCLPADVLARALLGPGGLAGQAGVGTLYLKEPANLPRDLQARLCDLLAEAGSPGRPRVVAGCSTDPAADVRTGRLLDELRCALGTLVLELPPLRERLDDLPWLVERMLQRCRDAGLRPVQRLTAEAWDVLRAFGWPGNLRELYAVLASACGRASGGQIQAADLPLYLRLPPAPPVQRPLSLKHLLRQAERRLIELALRKTKGNRSRAAELLSVWRPLLIRRMQKLGLAARKGGRKPDAEPPE
jgi:DNA-binding NtrC family response regulator